MHSLARDVCLLFVFICDCGIESESAAITTFRANVYGCQRIVCTHSGSLAHDHIASPRHPAATNSREAVQDIMEAERPTLGKMLKALVVVQGMSESKLNSNHVQGNGVGSSAA